MAGSAESSARLSVQKKKQAPTFIQSLRDGIVQANQRFEAEVEVQGTPIPEVHWFKNNNMIENSPRVFVRRDGRKCSLVIPKAQVRLHFRVHISVRPHACATLETEHRVSQKSAMCDTPEAKRSCHSKFSLFYIRKHLSERSLGWSKKL